VRGKKDAPIIIKVAGQEGNRKQQTDKKRTHGKRQETRAPSSSTKEEIPPILGFLALAFMPFAPCLLLQPVAFPLDLPSMVMGGCNGASVHQGSGLFEFKISHEALPSHVPRRSQGLPHQ
jgi:hypothetical protein